MEQRSLGRSGLQVSRLGLGTMTWGRDTDEHEARDQLLAFVAAGGTLVDTADVYADGRSEQIVGQLVTEVGRDAVVVATKAVGGAAPSAGSTPAAPTCCGPSTRRWTGSGSTTWTCGSCTAGIR